MLMSLTPGDLTILIDEREKRPFLFPGFHTVRARLLTGDYTIPGLEPFLGVEKKTRADFAYYLNGRRTKIEGQSQRLIGLARGLMVIEGDSPWNDEDSWRRAGIADLDLLKTMLRSWRARGLQIEYVKTHAAGAIVARDFLLDAANDYYRSYAPFFDLVNAGLSAAPFTKRAA